MTKKKFLGTLKQRIIVGIVALFFGGATAYIKGCFNNSKVSESKTDAKTENNYNGSGSQYNASRDIVINNNNPETKNDSAATQAEKSIPSTRPKVEPANNVNVQTNNGFINNGGKGNTYNQSLGKTQRHPTDNDISDILYFLPNKSYTIEIITMLGDTETYQFGMELISKIKALGYNAEFKYAEITFNQHKGVIGSHRNDTTKTLTLRVYSDSLLSPQ